MSWPFDRKCLVEQHRPDPQTGELPVGYKLTEVEMVPEDWQIDQVSSIANVRTGPFGSALHQRDYANEGTPIITVEHLGEHSISHLNLPLVSGADRLRLKSYELRTGDIVFSRVGSIDRNALVSGMESGWLFSGRLLRVRVLDQSTSPEYLSHYFSSEPFKRRILSVAVGQTMASLNTQLLRNVCIVLPPTLEQRAIARALSDVDALLASLEALIAKKRAIKRAAMQQLLTGENHLPGFTGNWETKRLGALLYYERPDRYIVQSTDYKEHGDTPVLTANKSFVLGYTDEAFGICDDVPAIVFDDFTTDCKYVKFPFKVKSSAIKLLRARQNVAHLRYVFECMQLLSFPIGDHKRYYLSEYQNIELPFPDLSEQTAIAAVLSDMEAEISALERRRDKTRAIKQGMMQLLLMGRVRLVEPEAVA